MNGEGLFVDDLPSDAGDGAPLVVLVHGSMDRHSSFARLRSRLMATCHVVSYDRRGYAASRQVSPAAGGLADHVEDLAAVVAGRRCTLVGHSYGGTVVLAFAARHPELARSVVAYEPPLGWLENWPSRGGPRETPFGDASPREAADAFMRRIVGERRYERLPMSVREEALKDAAALVTELTAIRNDGAPFEPAEIAVPVLVVRGDETAPHQIEGTDWLAANLAQASLRIIGGAGHSGHLSHASDLAAIVLEAVAMAEPGATTP